MCVGAGAGADNHVYKSTSHNGVRTEFMICTIGNELLNINAQSAAAAVAVIAYTDLPKQPQRLRSRMNMHMCISHKCAIMCQIYLSFNKIAYIATKRHISRKRAQVASITHAFVRTVSDFAMFACIVSASCQCHPFDCVPLCRCAQSRTKRRRDHDDTRTKKRTVCVCVCDAPLG